MMIDPVSVRQEGGLFLVTVHHPPVNALSIAVRKGIDDAIAQAERDTAVQAVVLAAKGSMFFGGADIREFNQPRVPPLLRELCSRLEALDKPVVAALNGSALGGGFEVALAAHYRVAGPGVEVALPEVQLGLMPGAGGTQRVPRLAGAAVALDLMLTGRRMAAAEALRLGLVDRIAQDPLAEAIAWARSLVEEGGQPRRSRDAGGLINVDSRAVIEPVRAGVTRASSHLFAPHRIVDAVEAACMLPFDEGLRLEGELFAECLASPQHQALVHAFFAERQCAKVPEATAATPRPVNHAGVIGGGTMGAGIAVALLDAGLRVTMVERDEASLERGRRNVAAVYDSMVAKRRMDDVTRAARLGLLQGATQFEALAQADVVIEAVFEDMAVKRNVFSDLQRVCKPGAVLATNTSYLDVDAIAASTERPGDVIGLHFFSPANVMKLLEIVVPRSAAADTVATGFALAKRLRKVAVRAGVCDGFIGNRMLAVYRRAAEYMVEDGASPYEIDAALRGFGFAMGPFQVMDLAGGDIAWATRKRRAATRDPRERYVQIADRLCERGWFGQKSGRGWYLYPEGNRQGQPDPEVLAIIDGERLVAGVEPWRFTIEEIVRRYLAAMVNEGAKILSEGIAARPLDIDVVRQHEEALAAEAIGHAAEHQRTEHRTAHVQRAGPADLRCAPAQRVAALQHAADRADDRHLQPVEHPGHAERDHDAPVPA